MTDLEKYKKYYEDCKKILQAINEDPDLDVETKSNLTDHFLDKMNEFQRYIDYLTLNN